METILIILIMLFGLFLIPILNLDVYCYIFEHKDYKLWKQIQKDINNVKYDYSYGKMHHFNWNNYVVVLWENESVSVHRKDNSCVLSDFHKSQSEKTAKLLKEKLQ